MRSDPKLAADVEQLTGVIAGAGASAHIVALARNVAEAQLDIVRIQRARDDLLAGSFASHPQSNHIVAAEMPDDTASALARLDRYERRALSRRKTAIRRLMCNVEE
jgi:hypothetical protein